MSIRGHSFSCLIMSRSPISMLFDTTAFYPLKSPPPPPPPLSHTGKPSMKSSQSSKALTMIREWSCCIAAAGEAAFAGRNSDCFRLPGCTQLAVCFGEPSSLSRPSELSKSRAAGKELMPHLTCLTSSALLASMCDLVNFLSLTGRTFKAAMEPH